MKDFSGKVALITGGGTGIGLATCRLLATRGCRVVITGRREAPLRAAANEFPDLVSHVCMDLANANDRDRALKSTLARHGRLDILVNNAGMQNVAPFEQQSDESIEKVIFLNLTATALLTKHAIRSLRETKGCIVNVSSTGANYVSMPPLGMATYGASKAGLNQLTRILAGELGMSGIRVNCVAPGATHTEMTTDSFSNPQVRAMLNAQTPLGRIGEPEEVAKVIAFLASDAAGWVTGQVLDASGGHWLRG